MMLSMPYVCSSCPSSNPAGPAPMIATFVRKPCSLDQATAECRNRTWLAMAMLSYNNIRKARLKPIQQGEMSMRKALLAVLLAATLSPALAQEKTFELKLSHWVPASHP